MNKEYAAHTAAYGNNVGGLVGAGQCIDYNPTVEENIDKRISAMKAEIERLEQSKVSLGPLLCMRINDIRSAMNY